MNKKLIDMIAEEMGYTNKPFSCKDCKYSDMKTCYVSDTKQLFCILNPVLNFEVNEKARCKYYCETE